MPILNLPDVTLVSIDTVCHTLTMMAIEECTRQVKFGDVKIFSDMDRCENAIHIPSFANYQEAGEFTAYVVPQHIKTKFALFIHWDSWIIDPSMWRDEFLEYDYIGAPWWYSDGYNVGNSGFCIRSKTLIDFLAQNKTDFPVAMPEDNILCRDYRRRLPQFKWAPTKTAHDFAFERSRASIESRSFGFHGIFNWPFVMSPAQLAERMSIARKNEYLQRSGMLERIDQVFTQHWHQLIFSP